MVLYYNMEILHNKEDFKWKDNFKVFEVLELEIIFTKSKKELIVYLRLG